MRDTRKQSNRNTSGSETKEGRKNEEEVEDGGTRHQERRERENTIKHVGIAARGGGSIGSKSRRGSEGMDVWRSEIKREK